MPFLSYNEVTPKKRFKYMKFNTLNNFRTKAGIANVQTVRFNFEEEPHKRLYSRFLKVALLSEVSEISLWVSAMEKIIAENAALLEEKDNLITCSQLCERVKSELELDLARGQIFYLRVRGHFDDTNKPLFLKGIHYEVTKEKVYLYRESECLDVLSIVALKRKEEKQEALKRRKVKSVKKANNTRRKNVEKREKNLWERNPKGLRIME